VGWGLALAALALLVAWLFALGWLRHRGRGAWQAWRTWWRDPSLRAAAQAVLGPAALVLGWLWLQGRGWPPPDRASWVVAWQRIAETLNQRLYLRLIRPEQTLAGLLALVLGLGLVARAVPHWGDGLRAGPRPSRSPRFWFALGGFAWALVLMLAPWPLPGVQAGLALLALGAVGYGLALRHGRGRWPRLTRADARALAFWLAVGGLVGLYRLADFPRHMLGDEGAFWDFASSLAREGYRASLFDLGVYSFPVLTSYFQAAVLRVFGATFWAWRWSSVLAWLAAVPFLYALLAAFTPGSRTLAHLGVAAYLFAPYGLAVSRYGYNNAQALPVVTAALAAAYAAYAYRNPTAWYVAGVLAGLGFYTYPAAHSAWWIVVALLLTHRGPYPRRRALGLFFLGLALTALPIMWTAWQRHGSATLYKYLESFVFNGFYARAMFGDAFVEGQGYRWMFPAARQELYWHPLRSPLLLLGGMLRTLLAFVQADLTVQRFIAFPLAGRWGAPLALVGLLALPRVRWRSGARRLLLLWLLLPMLFFSALNTFPPRALHMVALIPALAALIGLGLATGARVLARLASRPTAAACVRGLALGLGVLALAYGGWRDYFGQPPDLFPPHDVDIVTWAMLEADDQPFYFVYAADARDPDALPQPYGPRFRPDLFYATHAASGVVDLDAFPLDAVLFAYHDDAVLPADCIVHTFDTPQGPLDMCGDLTLARRLTAPSVGQTLARSYWQHPPLGLTLALVALLLWGRTTVTRPVRIWLDACFRAWCADDHAAQGGSAAEG